MEASSIIRKSKWKEPVEECRNNNAVIQANDFQRLKLAALMENGGFWSSALLIYLLPKELSSQNFYSHILQRVEVL